MFEVLHEENQWLVINKPSGISVHNAEDKSVIDHYDEVYPVHRLDKETSGILILSKNSSTTAKLQKALQASKKRYYCITRKPMDCKNGVWQFPLSEKAQGYKSPQGPKSDRKEAKTNWEVVEQNSFLSLLDVAIETGRTHQIRRHAVLSGHQVIGDKRYGESKYNNKISKLYKTDRMFLHAISLDLQFAGRNIPIKAELPSGFMEIFNSEQ